MRSASRGKGFLSQGIEQNLSSFLYHLCSYGLIEENLSLVSMIPGSTTKGGMIKGVGESGAFTPRGERVRVVVCMYNMYMYIYIYIYCMYVYIYIYIYLLYMYRYTIYVLYIYIYMYCVYI